MSVSFDSCATLYSDMAALYAALVVNDMARVTSKGLHILKRIEKLMCALPKVDVFGIYFAAPAEGEHGSSKVRHSEKGPVGEAAWKKFHGIVTACKAKGARGHLATPLVKYLAQFLLLVTVPEHNTTKLCPLCHCESDYFDPKRGKRAFVCKACPVACKDFKYDRDYGAASNIH